MIKTVVKDLFYFIKRPDDRQVDISIKTKLLYILILLVFELILIYTFVIPVLEWIDSILELKSDAFTYDSLLTSFILYVIIVPFIEELVFRHLLRYQGLKARLISATRWHKIFPYLVYFSSICFGLVHVSNYTNSGSLFFILSPLLVLSQLAGGLILAFIRVRLDFLWGVLYHGLWNFMVAIAIPVAEQQLFYEPYTETNSNYTVTINEQLFFDDTKEQSIKADSTGGRIYSLNIKQYSVQDVLDTLYTKDVYYGEDVIINLNLKSKAGIKKEEVLKILKKEYNIE
jgi:membrane protease YdiL (CAAX protease family)